MKSGRLAVQEDTTWGKDTEKQLVKWFSGVTLELAAGWTFISVLMWDCILSVQGGGHSLFSVQCEAYVCSECMKAFINQVSHSLYSFLG